MQVLYEIFNFVFLNGILHEKAPADTRLPARNITVRIVSRKAGR